VIFAIPAVWLMPPLILSRHTFVVDETFFSTTPQVVLAYA